MNKRIAAFSLLVALLVGFYVWWPWKHRVRAYNKSGRYLFSVPLDRRDCAPALNRCRAALQAIGGGVCKVPPHSLRLKNSSIVGADYPDAKIGLEGN